MQTRYIRENSTLIDEILMKLLYGKKKSEDLISLLNTKFIFQYYGSTRF
jgi:hypothetical protein